MSEYAAPDFRQRLASYVNGQDDSVLEAVAAGLTATKQQYEFTTCETCKGRTARYLVPIPDFKTRAQVFAILADQGFGKPPETRKVEATVDLTKSLREMTDDELSALADSLTG